MRWTSNATMDSGRVLDPRTEDIALKAGTGPDAHFAIYNTTWGLSDYLTPGRNDLLFDAWIPSFVVEIGTWSLEVDALLEDERHLFCIQVTQRLERDGEGGWPP